MFVDLSFVIARARGSTLSELSMVMWCISSGDTTRPVHKL